MIKPIIRVGNSAGVILPKSWYGGEAKIELIRKPLDTKKDIFEILQNYLDSVLGIFITGSYARNEQREDSSIDIIVITSDTNKKIIRGKYNIILISIEDLKKIISERVIPLYNILIESKPILNKQLLEKLKKIKIKKQALNWHLETTRSSLNIIKNFIELKKDKAGKDIVYTLMLRLKQLYIVECILKDKSYTNKDFMDMLREEIKDLKNINELYKIFTEENEKTETDIEELKKIYSLAIKILNKQTAYIKNVK